MRNLILSAIAGVSVASYVPMPDLDYIGRRILDEDAMGEALDDFQTYLDDEIGVAKTWTDKIVSTIEEAMNEKIAEKMDVEEIKKTI